MCASLSEGSGSGDRCCCYFVLTDSSNFFFFFLLFFFFFFFCFFFQAEDGIRDHCVTGVQTCALPILRFLEIF